MLLLVATTLWWAVRRGGRLSLYPRFQQNRRLYRFGAGPGLFSIGVAMAGMMTFGAYLPSTVSIPRAAITIALADTLLPYCGFGDLSRGIANGLIQPVSGPSSDLPVALGKCRRPFVSIMFFFAIGAAITRWWG